MSPLEMSRRNLLKAAALTGGITLLGSCRSWQRLQGQDRAVHWALLSDTHVPADTENNYRGFYPYRNMQKVAPQIAQTQTDGLIITGDLARLEGLPGDYAHARELLAPIVDTRPVCVGLGNHDHRENFLAAFADQVTGEQGVQGRHAVVIDAGPVRLIVLDSLFHVNQAAGLLGRTQRNWLAAYLQAHNDKPAILFFHHTVDDGDGDLLDAPRLFDMIRPARAVKALVFGHSHVYQFTQREGVHLINLPACGYNFGDDQPVGWVEAKLTARGGEFRVHAIAGNTAMDGQTTQVRWRS